MKKYNSIKTIAYIIFAFGMATSSPAQAEWHFYSGFGVGGISPKTNLVTDSLANTYFAVLGVQPIKYLGIEAGLMYSDWRNYADQTQKKVSGQASWSNISLATMGYLPLSNELSLFGKIGIANGVCNRCADVISTHSIIRGFGIAFGGQGEDVLSFRLGVENFTADTRITSDWSVDHVYGLVILGLK
jgi:hypothetical protein